jgi:O-antigen/teichoic acid export membrane protein
MTRLLFPEVYGLMTLVWAVLTGLQMFADTGIVPTIIRDKRGDDPDFLNTAFTTNVIRGFLLWAISFLIAYPMASYRADSRICLYFCIHSPPAHGLQKISDT